MDAPLPLADAVASPFGVAWARVFWVAWIAGLMAMAGTLATESVARAQEARVLLSARSMVVGPGERWIVPHANGEVRLRKPPLAYWTTALSFMMLGESAAAGRLPAMLTGWLGVLATYRIGQRRLGQRGGAIGAIALLGCFGLSRYGRLAETDIYILLLVTVAFGAFWRAHDRVIAGEGKTAWLWHLGGVMVGLAILTKGPPAGFPLLGIVGLAIADRTFRPVWSFLVSGAWLTAVAVAAWWILPAAFMPESPLMADMVNSSSGGGHSGWFFDYLPMAVVQAMPLGAVLVVAAASAVAAFRTDPAARGLVVWMLAMLVPLSLWGNKQPHYLVPVLPPLMLMVGRLIDLAASDRLARRWNRAFAWATRLTIAGLVLSAVAIPRIAASERGHYSPGDGFAAAGTLAAGVLLWITLRRRGPATAAMVLAVISAAGMPMLVGAWYPATQSGTPRDVADGLRSHFGDRNYVFFPAPANLSLAFHLGRDAPLMDTPEQLAGQLQRDPRTVVLSQVRPEADVATAAIDANHWHAPLGSRVLVARGGSVASGGSQATPASVAPSQSPADPVHSDPPSPVPPAPLPASVDGVTPAER